MSTLALPLLSAPLHADALQFLAEKIQGAFSFEVAAQTIGARISEGVAYLQENRMKVSSQVLGQEKVTVSALEDRRHPGGVRPSRD